MPLVYIYLYGLPFSIDLFQSRNSALAHAFVFLHYFFIIFLAF